MIVGKNRPLDFFRAAALAALVAAYSCAATATCIDSAVVWQVGSVHSASEWSESDGAGRRLVHESGALDGPELSVAYRCKKFGLTAQIDQLEGTRQYDGQTNSGASAVSRTSLRQQQMQLMAMVAVTDGWQLGGRISDQTIQRDIASAAAAAGYPERFNWTLLAIGAQWGASLGAGQFTLSGWAGRQLQSSMRVMLPGRDQATLPLGSINQIDLTAGWRMPLSSAWHLQADIGYHRLEMGPGASTVITRGGLPVGVAYQPRTVMVSQPVALRIGYEF